MVWLDKSIYFLTDSTYLHYPYFKTETQKQIVLNQIKKLSTDLGIKISDYSIAINHYHLKFYLSKGSDMEKVKQLLRGGISYEYRRRQNVLYKEMWQTRKIFIVYNEKINWKISGYIIGNLLKHKEVSTFAELAENKFSSFWYIAQKYGFNTAKDLVQSVINIEEGALGAVDVDSFKV